MTGPRLPPLAVVALCLGFGCTELDALSGSAPELPWSPTAPRWSTSPRVADPPPYGVSTSVDADGFVLSTDLPRAAADCPSAGLPSDLDLALCADDDRDGLVDEWEDVALDYLRPFVRIDDGDPLRADPSGRVASVGRVTPRPHPGGATGEDSIQSIHLLLVLGYSRDYGRCTFGGHLGDSERVALELVPVPGQPGSVRLRRAYTAAHEWSHNDVSRLHWAGDGDLEFAEDPLTGQRRWVVYASRSKHATYAAPAQCEAQESWIICGDEDCAAGRSISPPNELLMPVDNAGEPDAPRAEEMMDEPVWDDVPFCGGLGHGGDDCASPLRAKLLADPFVE